MFNYLDLEAKYVEDRLSGYDMTVLHDLCAKIIDKKTLTPLIRKRIIANVKTVGAKTVEFVPKSTLSRTKLKPVEMAWQTICFVVEYHHEALHALLAED